MAVAEFLAELDQLGRDAGRVPGCPRRGGLEAPRIEFLGMKSGRLKAAQKGLGPLDKADKPQAGQRFNQLKQQIEGWIEPARSSLAGTTAAAEGPRSDPTVPGIRPRLGHLHPLTQTIEELKDLMGRLGFSAVDGPEVEDEWHNFEALNIPVEHPVRNPLDNFYLATAGGRRGEGETRSAETRDHLPLSPPLPISPSPLPPPTEEHGLLLRSQTSTVQIRVMEKSRRRCG